MPDLLVDINLYFETFSHVYLCASINYRHNLHNAETVSVYIA